MSENKMTRNKTQSDQVAFDSMFIMDEASKAGSFISTTIDARRIVAVDGVVVPSPPEGVATTEPSVGEGAGA